MFAGGDQAESAAWRVQEGGLATTRGHRPVPARGSTRVGVVQFAAPAHGPVARVEVPQTMITSESSATPWWMQSGRWSRSAGASTPATGCRWGRRCRAPVMPGWSARPRRSLTEVNAEGSQVVENAVVARIEPAEDAS